jgi:hypothetical protein
MLKPLQSQVPEHRSLAETIGTVVDNNDPRKAQRVRLEIPGLFDPSNMESLPWIQCEPTLFGGGSGNNYGGIMVPAIGARLRVTFPIINGVLDQRNGRVVGAVMVPLDAGTLPEELTLNYPNRQGFITPSGVLVYIDNATGEFMIRSRQGTGYHCDEEGNLNINAKGKSLNILAGNFNLVVENDYAMSAANLSEDVQGTTTRAATSNLIKGDTQIEGKLDVTGDILAGGNVTANDGIFSGKSFLSHKHIAKGSATSPPV